MKKTFLILIGLCFFASMTRAKSAITIEPHNEGKNGWLLRTLVDVDFNKGFIGHVRHNVDGPGKLTALIGYKAKAGKFILNGFAGATFDDKVYLLDLRLDFVGVFIHKRFSAVLLNTLGLSVSPKSKHNNYAFLAASMEFGRFNLGAKIDYLAVLEDAKSIFLKFGPRVSFSAGKRVNLGLWTGWLKEKNYDHAFVRFEMKWAF